MVGAGGLGCELLKQLTESNLYNLTVIDMDVIELTNLNRQFLFHEEDIGLSKAETAAKKIRKVFKKSRLVAIHGKIQDQPISFFNQFELVISGLDSIEARRYLNSILYQLAIGGNIIPWIDGGTEGFKGQARVILSTLSACFECSLPLFPKKKTYPLCTLASTPRQPEHCIEWAAFIEYPKLYVDTLDYDNIEHMQIVYELASKRAKKHNIEKVTFQLTQTVLKNIIPAISTTNAIIAGICSQEAFNLITGCLPNLNNYWAYSGENSVYSHSFELEKRDDCALCGCKIIEMDINGNPTLKEFIESLEKDPIIACKNISLRTNSKSLFMCSPYDLMKQTLLNLDKKLRDLVEENEIIVITSSQIAHTIQIKTNFK